MDASCNAARLRSSTLFGEVEGERGWARRVSSRRVGAPILERSRPAFLPLFTQPRRRNSRKSISSILQGAPDRSTKEPFAPLLCIEVNSTCVSSAWISAVVNGTGSSSRRWNSLLWGLRLIDSADPLAPATSHLQRNRRRINHEHT